MVRPSEPGLLMRSVPAHSARNFYQLNVRDAASCFVGSYAGSSNYKPSAIP
jgi:hypothetical protein